MMRPDGKIMHADLKIGDSHVMISEEMDKHPAMPCMVHLYVPNVDAVHQHAVAAGGKSSMEPTDMFYGDRAGSVTDPSGNRWYIATHKEDVAMPAAQTRRGDVQAAEGQGGVASARPRFTSGASVRGVGCAIGKTYPARHWRQ